MNVMVRNSEVEILNILKFRENAQGMERRSTVSQVCMQTSDGS